MNTVHEDVEQALNWLEEPEKEMETSVFFRSIPWTEERGELQSRGLQRARHALVTEQQQ